MALPADSDNETLSRDPFRLDRLADELATRESSRSFAGSLDDLNGVDLPEHIPLSHNDKYLTAEVFNIEEFLLSRSRTSLPDLRAELRQYLAELKEELVKLINDDYEAFISLSTDLRDEGARLERLKHPLGSLRTTVLESKVELQDIQKDIHDKLTKRARLREEKALLHLLLKISESVIRLESLLLISSPDQNAKESMEINNANFLLYPSHSEDGSDEKLRGNRAKHLGRVSAEYTQLLYHVRKARTENCAFVDEVQWRIDRVHSTLSSDLDQLFAQTLALTIDSKGESRGSELEKNKWMADLTECLRTYDILGLWRDAEDVIRREVVRNFVKKTIYPGALAASHSPIVPHTPFHPPVTVPRTSTIPMHQIPYTPFTAFVPKPTLYQHTTGSLSELPQVQLLEDADDPLTHLYNQILRFVERDICRIMDIAEKVTVKPTSARPTDLSSNPEDLDYVDTKNFQIMANVVWDELARSITAELGGIVFASGRPNEFRKHYETTQAFIRSLELLAPSMQAIQAMRHHPTYVAFERRWQLPVYFQLRWKEIVGALEEALSGVHIEPNAPKDGSFVTSQGSATWIALSACWSSEIYIPELSPRFWRLTLQILSRYKMWMSESNVSGDTLQEKNLTSQNSLRVATSVETPAETPAVDDALLRRYAAAIIDINVMETNVNTLWRQIISEIIPDALREEDLHMEDALRESLSGLTGFIRPLSSEIIFILTKRCCEALLPARSIPSQFRAMSNKRMPVEPSYFVTSILRPVKQFFAIGVAEGPGSLLKDALLESFSTEVFNNVTQRYIGYLAAMKKTEESLKRLKKGKKSTFSLFGNSSNVNDETKDEERIRSQMILDVEAFGKDGESLKVEVVTNTHFVILKEMVYASDLD